ncbi:MAG: CHAT domain-containing tetratricopeptide repeat protein [Bacteroidota bacterium]
MMRFYSISCLLPILIVSCCCQSQAQETETDSVSAHTYFQIGDSLNRLGLFQQARAQFQQSATLFSTSGDWINYVKAQNSLFTTWAGEEKYREGEPYLREALANGIPQLGKRHLALADTYANLGTYFEGINELDSQLIYLQLALSIQLDSLPPNHPALSATHSNLGLAYQSVGDYDAYLTHSRKSFEIVSNLETPDLFILAIVAHNYGGAHREMGHFLEAIKYSQFAIGIFQDSLKSKHPALASIYNAMGDYHNFIGKGEQAISYLFEALRIRQEIYGPNTRLVARSHSSIARTYMNQRMGEKAMEHYLYALNLYQQIEPSPSYAQGSVSLSIGSLYLGQGQLEKSRQYFQLAKNIWTNILPADHPYQIQLLAVQGDLAFQQHKLQEALSLYQQALELSATKSNLGMAVPIKIHSGFAKLYSSQKNWKKAIHHHHLALQAFIPVGVKDVPSPLSAEFPLEQIDQLPQFLANLKSTCLTLLIAFQESHRPDYLDMLLTHTDQVLGLEKQLNSEFRTEDKLQIIQKSRPILEFAIQGLSMERDSLRRLEHLPKAFSYFESSRALQLQESLHKNRAEQFAGLPANLLQLERDIRQDLIFYRKKQHSLLARNATDQIKLDLWIQKAVRLEQRQDSLKEVFRTQYPEYYHLRFGYMLPSLADIQKKLPAETAIISYFRGDSSLFSMVVRNHSVHLSRLCSAREFQHRLSSYLDHLHLSDPTAFLTQYSSDEADRIYHPLQVESHALYQTLIAPMTSYLEGSTHLMIIPDREVGLLPFAALSTEPPPGGQYLIHRYRTSYAYGASFLAEAWQSSSRNSQKTYGGFAPIYSPNQMENNSLIDLPFARKEVQKAAELFSGDAFLGEEASKSRFTSVAGNYKILHLAMHTQIDSGNMPTFVFFHQADESASYLLQTTELYGYSLPSQLAVLSACNTGKGEWKSGEGILSLAHAFAYAGCRSQVMSLWQVDDQTGSEIVLDFYEALEQGQTVDQALRTAKLAFLNTTGNSRLSHPYFWATFLAVGDMKAVQVHAFGFTYLVIGLLFLLILIMGIGYLRRTSSRRLKE